MRCQYCKTCLSAIKEGHLECLKTFNYKKSKNAMETAARHKQREIYNFLKEAGCPRSFVGEIYPCAQNGWNSEFYSFFSDIETLDHETRMSVIRHLGYASVRHNDITLLRQVIMHIPTSFIIAFVDVVDLNSLFEETIKSEHVQKIELIYNDFRHRFRDWYPRHFEYAISTGNINTLKKVIEMWKGRSTGLTGVENTIKLATIKNNRLDMLKMLDREINGYPEDMMHQLRRTRGYSTEARRQMTAYVWEEIRCAERRGTTTIAERARERERIEQRQATAVPVAPVEERVTNLHKALAVIEDCGLPEGKYLELCNLLMDVHRRGVRV